ncbi:hypothetical protein GCM10009863_40360 [Streptomyces axinellae]|uniref:Acyclic terpene utilisation N-terminal domain-containing protein n=1 Tax=Streptomyces axinellae TaxID=552788 RepID=A0ABP6CNB0_9ACTN
MTVPPSTCGSGRDGAPLRIGNASGFYGDRFAAFAEMLTGGPLDVLTGDYLAELTVLILGRDRMKDPARGYAETSLRQLEEGLALARERGVVLVTNAGGLNPAGLADAVRELSARVGVPARVAHVEGDDLLRRGPGPGSGSGGGSRGLGLANLLTDDSARRERVVAQWARLVEGGLSD